MISLYCDTDDDSDLSTDPQVLNPDYFDTDSDTDDCSDTDEAYGYGTDTNGDGTYGGVVAAYDSTDPTAADGVAADGTVNAASYTYTVTSSVVEAAVTGVEITEDNAPDDVSVCGTEDATFTSDFSGVEAVTYDSDAFDTTTPLTAADFNYQWTYNDGSGYQDITGATSASLTVSDGDAAYGDGYSYIVQVWHDNLPCYEESTEVTLTINDCLLYTSPSPRDA